MSYTFWEYVKYFGNVRNLIMTDYTLLSVPEELQGPSNENGQILIDGIAQKISLFHGSVDDECDWHVYVSLDEATKNILKNHLQSINRTSQKGFDSIYCEVMVLSKYENSLFDEKFFSSDVTLPFRLKKLGVVHPGIDMGEIATESQGDNHVVGGNKLGGSSELVTDRGRVYLQGAFVTDDDHRNDAQGDLIEIHPLDSIAFAMNKNGKTIFDKAGGADWPSDFVHWRVAIFGNSAYHRINGASYLEKPRVVTWLLDLPKNHPVRNPTSTRIFEPNPIFRGFTVNLEQKKFWHPPSNNYIFQQGNITDSVRSRYVLDQRDNRIKYEITQRIEQPDRMGSMIIFDITMKVFQMVNA